MDLLVDLLFHIDVWATNFGLLTFHKSENWFFPLDIRFIYVLHFYETYHLLSYFYIPKNKLTAYLIKHLFQFHGSILSFFSAD